MDQDTAVILDESEPNVFHMKCPALCCLRMSTYVDSLFQFKEGRYKLSYHRLAGKWVSSSPSLRNFSVNVGGPGNLVRDFF